MNRPRTRRAYAVTGSVLAITAFVLLTAEGCENSKISEPYNDAPRAGTNSGSAEIVTMPDGFSNMATKCDHGNRVYSAFHGDSPYASIVVVAADPTCKGK